MLSVSSITMSLTKRPPKTRSGKMFLKNREPKLVENDKQILFMFGQPCSSVVKAIFRDLAAITKPNSKVFDRKKTFRPFEDHEPIEYLSKTNDAALFGFGSHIKKRPHNMIFGRCFDNQLLDMVELGVESWKLLGDFKGVEGNALGSKPLLLFAGDLFDTSSEFMTLKSIFADMFKGTVVDKISLIGLDHVIKFIAIPGKDGKPGKVLLRHYRIKMMKSGTRVPKIELEEMGPRLDMVMRRVRQPAEALMKLAVEQPKTATPKKRKNIETNVLGDTVARIHMRPQDYSKLQTRKVRALKKLKPAKAKEALEGADTEGGNRGSKRVKKAAAAAAVDE